jgi:hypothetical protein
MTEDKLQKIIEFEEDKVRNLTARLSQERKKLQEYRGALLLLRLNLKLGDELKSSDGKKKGIVESADDNFHFKLRLYKADHTLGKSLVNVFDSHVKTGRWVKTGYNIND